MVAKKRRLKGVSLLSRLVPTNFAPVALAVAFWAIMPAMARAQTNIDQGKPPSEIFANDCAVCHKTTRGLANGKNSLVLQGFLREHYTASREQAAALAAYVLGAGGNGPAPPQTAGQKPLTEPKTAARPAKPEDEPAIGTKPGEQGAGVPLQRPPGRHDLRPVTASRSGKPEPETPTALTPEPAGTAAPATGEPQNSAQGPISAQAPSSAQGPSPTPAQDASPTTSAAAPAESQPGDIAPVPRDNIPD
jgi:hypothetical protein